MARTPDNLMQALSFNKDDLRSNRGGRLSETQINRIRQIQRRAMFTGMGVVFSLDLLAAGFMFAGFKGDSPILILIGMALLTVSAVSVGMFARHWLRLSADLRAGEVEILEGKLERVVRQSGRSGVFLIRIGGAEFAVTKEVFNAFQHESPYRVYRAPHSNVLLAAETVDLNR